MIEQDTVRLLRECDAGIKMGVDSIEEVINRASSKNMRSKLSYARSEHDKLASEIENALNRFGDDGKRPNPIVKGMSHLKTGMKMFANGNSDRTIADLMTDGCNMGTKSLSRYLNKYKAADESSKDIAKRLISIEDKLRDDMREFL